MKPPKPGPPLDLTPEAIDYAATITPFDTMTAEALWRAKAPPRLADLLNAAPEEP